MKTFIPLMLLMGLAQHLILVLRDFVKYKVIAGETARYPKSAAKIKFMVQRFEEDGFTSYWL